MRRGVIGWVVASVIAIGMGATAPAEAEAKGRRAKAGAEVTIDELGWPRSTRSARAKRAAKVYRKAAGRGRIGKLAKGTRVGWTRIVASRDRCKGWIEIEPRGWVCARDLEPSDDEPEAGTDSATIVARIAATEYAGIEPAGADAYDTLRRLRRGRASRRLEGWTFLHEVSDRVTVGGVSYRRTDRGWIDASKIVAMRASGFEGVELTAERGLPLGWVVPARRDARVNVRVAPEGDARVVREVERREVVAVLEMRDGFARIGDDEWVDEGELRIARGAERPEGIGAGERWIDVDLDQQVLVAYEGDVPVFATLMSGGRGKATPTAIHRIKTKFVTRRMRAAPDSLGTWDIPDVPFVMRFRKNYAVHGVYWHDSFGKKRSHGCVNVSPRDARRLFDWTFPQVPDGWLEARARGDEGTPIRLRNRRDPDPVWTDYDAPSPVKRRKHEET